MSSQQLNAVNDTVQRSSVISLTEIANRNASVDKQLFSMNLQTINVIGDGNCFFQAISVCGYSNQSRYKELRANVASHMLAEGKKIVARINLAGSGDDSIRKSADVIKSDDSWVGEDAILAAADYLRQ